MTRTTRIGLVGYGFGGRYFHAPLIESADGAELAGVVTRSPARRAEVEAEHPGVPVFGSLADLAAAGAEAVAISTPADTHIALVLEAIDLGLGVVCDKPFALDAESARPAVLAAEGADVVLTVYQNRRWDADFLTVRKVIASGDIGRPIRFESRFERFTLDRGPSPSGGGLLLDFGAHLFDQALQLFGPAESVYAEADLHRTDLDGRPLPEDRFFAAVRHRDGVTSHLSGSWVEGAPGPRYRVTGTAGSFLLAKTMEGQEHALRAGDSPAEKGESWGLEPQADWGAVHQDDTITPVVTERGRWDTFYPAFAAAVRGEGPVPVDPWDAVVSLQLIDAARASARTGQVMKL